MSHQEPKVKRLCSFTLDEKVIEKLNYITAKRSNKNKSNIVERLIEVNYAELRKAENEEA
jgi:metal-responsive CopG/Arc/MetJ family transcriptional regulator